MLGVYKRVTHVPPGVQVPAGTGTAEGGRTPGQSSAGAGEAGEGREGDGGDEEVSGTPC